MLGSTVDRLWRSIRHPGVNAVLLSLLSATLIALWFYFSTMEILAAPDFYKYYHQAQRILQLDFSKFIIPPLHPFLLGLFSRIIQLFNSSEAIPLWVGRTLNLAATMACLFFLNRLAIRYFSFGRFYFLWAVCLSPLFLCFHSTPLTEMLFLCFLLGFIDALSRKNPIKLLLFALIASATRIEGLPLLAIAVIHLLNTNRILRKKSRIILFFTLCISGLLLFISFFLQERILFLIHHLTDQEGIFYFLLNPHHLAHIIYSNFFYFLPAPAPLYFQFITLSCLGLLFYFGIRIVLHNSTFMAWSILIYLAIFFASKGYLSSSSSYSPETRRVLYAIILIALVSFWGIQSIYHRAKRDGQLGMFSVGGILFLLFLVLHIPSLTSWFSPWSILIALPLPLFYLIQMKSQPSLVPGLCLRITLAFLFSLLISISFRMGRDYLNSSPNKGAYAIAQYMNSNPDKAPFLLVTENDTLEYYLKTNPKREWYGNGERDDTLFISDLQKAILNKQIRGLAFDFYLSRPDAFVTIDKTHLMQLVGRADLFMPRPLIYKGQLVAFVLSPRFQSSPILHPMTGDIWTKGELRKIEWNANALSGYLKISLLQQENPVGVIRSSVAAVDGSFNWIVGQLKDGRFVSGDQYRIQIEPASPIIVSSPADGELWKPDEIRTISWSNPGGLTGTVSIELVKDGVPIGTISAGVPIEAGQYNWRVGQMESGRCESGDRLCIAIRPLD